MIKDKIKNAKGISLISLAITIVVLVLIANVIIYNVKDNLRVGKLKGMQNDIANLRDKVASYYAQNGKIPASVKYTNISHIKSAGVISDAVDTGNFLVIELSALENLTLNYGEDFDKVKEVPENANEYKDLYIINETSHNIFYVQGITIDNETFYTDYTSKDVDKKSVVLRYVEGVKIPDGFYYYGGTKDTGIIIKSNDNTGLYKWMQIDETITKVPNDIQVDTNEEEDFIKSANAYKGYYKSIDSSDVIYLELNKWSPRYDKGAIYKDEYGDTAYIPQGFQVSEVPGQNTVGDGLVVRAVDESEFVWVPVETPVSDAEANATNNKAMAIKIGNNYRGLLYNFSGTTSTVKSGCTTTTLSNREPAYLTASSVGDASSYNTIGITEESLQGEYNSMMTSVEKYKGFYVGRYETSMNGQIVASKAGITPMNDNRWYEMYQKQKEYAGENDLISVSSSMIWGSQYDAMLNWILTGKDKEKVASNNVIANNGDDIVNTGTRIADRINNIYDLSGNLWERTLEAYDTDMRVIRGEYYSHKEYPPSYRYTGGTEAHPSAKFPYVGSRLVLYVKE